MSGANRIAGKGRLSPARTVRFTFDGRSYEGIEGDTLASALLANGVHLVGRSFKYHRPRGILSAGPEEPNALVRIDQGGGRQTPNVRATVQEVHDGLNATSQNRYPSLAFDIGAVNDRVSPVLPAGFYYKTFMWPKAAWKKIYEPNIRAAAGLGAAPDEPDPDRYANRFEHCDVLIVGAGLAGLAATLSAARTGASVILCDESPEAGGAMIGESNVEIDGMPGFDWARKSVRTLEAMDNVRVLTRTTAFGYLAQNMMLLAQRLTDHRARPGPEMARERLWQVRAKRIILAAGSIERPMVFAGNDRPGIMLAGAARTYLNHYGVAVGARIGVFTAHDGAYDAAFDLKRAGRDITSIVDFRREPGRHVLDQASALGIEVLAGHGVTRTRGRLRISGFDAAPRGAPEEARSFSADALLISAGWTPSVHLFSQSRAKVRWDADNLRFLPGEPVQDCRSVGACNGTDDLDALIEESIEAGAQAGRHAGGSAAKKALSIAASRPAPEGSPSDPGMIGDASFEGAKGGKAFVDFQNDVTAKDIRLAVREGFHSIEHVKRFTTNGMATDQGKTSNMNGLAIAADTLGKPLPEVGLTTFRAPFTPVSFGTMVNYGRGPLFEPVRRTPLHGWLEENGAIFEDVGQWKRAWYLPRPGEDMHEAVNRECRTVRKTAGMFDASTLGKIEVTGPDAAEFLNRIYTNPFLKLGVGRLRYGIMLREDGFIYDDGVVGRIAEDRFHVTTTTGGAPRVLGHMEDYLQTEFPDLKVYLTSISEQWAVIAVQGPKSAEILEPLIEDIDLSLDAMPHMSMREGRVCGVPTRLFRMSFTGEQGFEINVPADFARDVWQAVWERAEPLGACVYGTEAMHVLRAEKGYIIVGQDTDGTVTPDDAGLGWAIGSRKTDFVGMRGLQRADLIATGRKQLVGLETVDPMRVLEEGAQIVADPNQAMPMTMIGHVTSAYWSEACNRSIALALVEGGRDRMGETVYLPMPDGTVEARITGTVFFDPDGDRLNG